MKNILLILTIAFCSTALSQNGWFTQFNEPTVIIQDLYFIDEITGWAVGFSGTILRTTNGGNNWVHYNLSPDFQLSSVRFANYNLGFVSGLSYDGDFHPYLFRTTDGGFSWNISFQNFLEGGTISGISFPDENTGFFGITYSGIGHIYKTANSGVNWTLVNANIGQAYGVSDIYFKDAEKGYASLYKTTNQNSPIINTIIKTTDAGNSWFEIHRDTVPYSNSNYNRKILFFNDYLGYLQRGDLFKTTNGGINFISTASGFINSYFFANTETGWCTGYNGKILKTTTGGNSWIPQNINSNSDLFPVFFVNSSTGWAGGYIRNNGGGLIVKTYTGGINPVNNTGETVTDYRLFQNYPNPFNPSTNIKFNLNYTCNVTLTVYNALGAQVAVLIDGMQQAGSYNVKFAADKYNLPSGIYFYTLISGNFMETKKFVLYK